MKNRKILRLFISLFVLFLFITCKKGEAEFSLPVQDGIPTSLAPADNVFSQQKAVLGRYLFYDKRLSGDQTMSCASCHDSSLAFTDGNVLPRGIPDRKGGFSPRNSPNLTNTGYTRTYTWINPGLNMLEAQAMVPIFLDNAAIELGLAGKEAKAIELIKKETYYQEMFPKAFPDIKDPINIPQIVAAIASFERTFVSFNSGYDQFEKGNSGAITEKAKKGKTLFFSEDLKCSKCHSGKFFTDAQDPAKKNEEYMHDNGLHNKYPDSTKNEGLSEVSHITADVGKFKTPTLRNVALTYPYMHDGSINCDKNVQGEVGTYSEKCARQALKRVIENYASGGKKGMNQDKRITGFKITESEKDDLVEFLLSLTDQSFVTNTFYQNPMPSDPMFGR
jgi:cytochrome c peroxidase